MGAPAADGLVPFEVTRSSAAAILTNWLSGQRLVSADARDVWLAQLRGTYVPHWMFDLQPESDSQAASAAIMDECRALLEPASAELMPDEVREMGPYRIAGRLTGFQWDYLAGFDAEIHSLSALECWTSATVRINELETTGAGQVCLETRSSRAQAASVLLPMYLAAYRERGRVYRIRINGQTGQVAGEVPAGL